MGNIRKPCFHLRPIPATLNKRKILHLHQRVVVVVFPFCSPVYMKIDVDSRERKTKTKEDPSKAAGSPYSKAWGAVK